ncbi:hypothetical protein ABZ754_03940 [Micromonospora purpureochromogenes]|uniref:hypothetical protein n=1 Tax=Micromonospora purpureochromogenes TaxID=47872 RepID=UPI0033CBE51E
MPGERFYWSVDIPGLRERDVEELTRLIDELERDLVVVPVDPSYFLTMHLDRSSVQALLDASATSTDIVLGGLRESMLEWLQDAAPDEDEEGSE